MLFSAPNCDNQVWWKFFFILIFKIYLENVFVFMCVGVLSACIPRCLVYVWWPQGSTERVACPGPGVIDSCESLCGC